MPKRHILLPFILILAALCEPAIAQGLVDEDGLSAFRPFWSFNTTVTHSAQEGGQTSNDLNLTASWTLAEAGHNISLGATGGNRKLDGERTSYGNLTLGGGLGWGAFFPSLALTGGSGGKGLRTGSIALNLDFEVARFLTLGLGVSAQTERHTGTAQELLGTTGLFAGRALEITSLSKTGGVSARTRPWDWMSFSLAFDRTLNHTEGIRDVKSGRGLQNTGGSGSTISGSAGLGFNISKHWSAGFSHQRGRDFYPGENYYLPRLGSTVNFSGGSSTFWGSSLWVGYSF